MKASIFNLIILDESGSMGCVKRQTINGCNETLNTIRSAQKNFADTQQHFVSIYVFQDNTSIPSRYLVKNQPIDEVKDITSADYNPEGCTPLNDAVGSTLTDLQYKTKGIEGAIGSVTIITDGEENSSTHYTTSKVSQMISQLKELGWNFNFIGANIDVRETASAFSIDNAMEFEQSDEGTDQMFELENTARMGYYSRVNQACACSLGSVNFVNAMQDAASNYFRDEQEENETKEETDDLIF